MVEGELPRTSIKRMPDVALEVGYLIMTAANFDCWMHPAMAAILDSEIPVAEAIMTRVESISSKFDILVDVAKGRSHHDISKAVLANESKVRPALKFRNKVAHGLFGFEEDGTHILVPFPYSKRHGKRQTIYITAETVRPHTEAIGGLIRAISAVVGESYLPHQ